MGLNTVINLTPQDQNPNSYKNKISQAHQVIIQEISKIRDSLTSKELDQAKLLLTKKTLINIQKQFDRIDENVLFYVSSPQFLENSIEGFEKIEKNSALQLTEEIQNVTLDQMKAEFMRIVDCNISNAHLGYFEVSCRNSF